jgi:hypothetical protein
LQIHAARLRQQAIGSVLFVGAVAVVGAGNMNLVGVVTQDGVELDRAVDAVLSG